jgi:hypothetical protein
MGLGGRIYGSHVTQRIDNDKIIIDRKNIDEKFKVSDSNSPYKNLDAGIAIGFGWYLGTKIQVGFDGYLGLADMSNGSFKTPELNDIIKGKQRHSSMNLRLLVFFN